MQLKSFLTKSWSERPIIMTYRVLLAIIGFSNVLQAFSTLAPSDYARWETAGRPFLGPDHNSWVASLNLVYGLGLLALAFARRSIRVNQQAVGVFAIGFLEYLTARGPLISLLITALIYSGSCPDGSWRVRRRKPEVDPPNVMTAFEAGRSSFGPRIPPGWKQCKSGIWYPPGIRCLEELRRPGIGKIIDGGRKVFGRVGAYACWAALAASGLAVAAMCGVPSTTREYLHCILLHSGEIHKVCGSSPACRILEE